MIPYSRLKLSDLYALSQSEQLENRTVHSGTYLYSPYMLAHIYVMLAPETTAPENVTGNK